MPSHRKSHLPRRLDRYEDSSGLPKGSSQGGQEFQCNLTIGGEERYVGRTETSSSRARSPKAKKTLMEKNILNHTEAQFNYQRPNIVFYGSILVIFSVRPVRQQESDDHFQLAMFFQVNPKTIAPSIFCGSIPYRFHDHCVFGIQLR